MSRWMYLALLVTVLGGNPAQLFGQRMSFSMGHVPAFPAATSTRSLTISFHGRPVSAFHRPVLLPGFFSSPFWFSDYPDQPALVEAAPMVPPVVVVEPASAPSQEKPAPSLLVLERRGDVFVRIHNAGEEGGDRFPTESKTADSSRVPAAQFRAPRNDKGENSGHGTPTVLIYRDGHREETPSYTIVNGMLYESSDYWSTGTWTKSVNLASLDLSATARENELRGTKFLLPAGPNEVVIRP